MEVKEDLLHHIWKFRLFHTPLRDPHGSIIEVLDTGRLNTDSGPDFFNARIKSGPLIWVGNVEIHLKASDWYRHGHHLDPAYDNVILHGVVRIDRETMNSSGRKILTVKINLDPILWQKYWDLRSDQEGFECWKGLPKIKRETLNSWIEKLYFERLEERTKAVKHSLQETAGDWEDVLYRSLGKAMGQKTNAEPFEILTRSISIGQIARHCPDLHMKESVLFGQAGMLKRPEGDSYYLALKETYTFLRGKLDLHPMDGYLWKYLRLRPMNFPEIRIAQFAWMVDKYPTLFSHLSGIEDPVSFIMKMKISTSQYWTFHYRFNKPGQYREKIVGAERLSGMLINAVVPVLCLYNLNLGRLKELFQISHIPAQLPCENNRVIRLWKRLGIPVNDGFSSQAILQLTDKYCIFKKSLSCYVAAQISKTFQEMEDG